MKSSIIAASLCLLLGGTAAASTSQGTETLALETTTGQVRKALDWLAQQASKREASREDYGAVASLIISRAREVFADEVEFLEFESNVEQCLRRALDALADRIVEGKATREDCERIVDMLMSRARDLESGSFGE